MPKIIVRDHAGLEKIIEVQSLTPQFTTEEIVTARLTAIEHDPALKPHLAHFRKAGISQEELESQIRQQVNAKLQEEKVEEKTNLAKVVEHIPQHQQSKEVGVTYGPSSPSSRPQSLYGASVDSKGHDISLSCPCGQTIKIEDTAKKLSDDSVAKLAAAPYSAEKKREGETLDMKDKYNPQRDTPAAQYAPTERASPVDYMPQSS